MNMTLLALISELSKEQKRTRSILSAYDIYDWDESKALMQAYQELLNKLDTAKG